MTTTLPGAVAVVLYVCATTLQLLRLRGVSTPRRLMPLLVGVALVLHATAAARLLLTPHGLDLGLFIVLSATTCVVLLIAVIASVTRPVSHLFTLLMPLCAVSLTLSITVTTDYQPRPLPAGLLVHIGTSILAYAVLCIAACQALLLAYQDRQLRHSRRLAVLRALPPLTRMEDLLFQMVWLGMAVLSVAIVTGLLFLDDMFAQRVVHHTVLSLTSWAVFALLLWGRHALGWRGATAIRWTLAGFGLLVLAWLGTKAVIEVILGGG